MMLARSATQSCVVRKPSTTAAHVQLPRTSVRLRYRLGEYDVDNAGPEDYDVTKRAEIVATGVVFSPSAELSIVMPGLTDAPMSKIGPSGVPTVSLGRMDYARKSETAINEQINVELNMSYLYMSMASYFGRDNVGLPGFSAHFMDESDSEREHAKRLMEFQTRRGGRVVLASLLAPQTEFEHPDKGDALFASQIALAAEKLNFAKLRQLHSFADEADDADMAHFLEDYLIDEQSRDVKEAAVLVSQLQRVGKGLGVFQIDLALQQKYGVKGADQGLNGVPDATLAVTPLL